MDLREATPGEYDEIGRLTVDTYRALREGGDLGDYEAELRDVARRAVSGTVLAAVDDDGAVLGAVTYVPGPDSELAEFDDEGACGIRMLAVDPRFQGRGIGRALTVACIERGHAAGRSRVLLHSTPEMTVAHALYATLGFERTTERDVVVDTVNGPLLLMGFALDLA